MAGHYIPARQSGETILAADYTAHRELGGLSRVQSIFSGTTEIMKEIVGRGLGL